MQSHTYRPVVSSSEKDNWFIWKHFRAVIIFLYEANFYIFGFCLFVFAASESQSYKESIFLLKTANYSGGSSVQSQTEPCKKFKISLV